ncbi:NAD-dependent epimerase/dehydratase family protein [Thalassomonas haliotis]|uniref:NAD(P)-dependent oxidoreductase n=1 Tax=Thalassomonas haliotis TaxID=485448 RepID=A0ABY7VI91_9GAMM|nr:NAD(P)-dependent oxidoreductase [Thalassomonas haliotis]WDE12761.1 NAD(P)-dependent oxidoreductase [Thalassomonas haliotis]
MNILVTGSAGRVGRAIYIHLMKKYRVTGVDKTPCSTADIVGDIRDNKLLEKALPGVDVIVHCAALHAPHVGLVADEAFASINVKATERLALSGLQAGVKHFVFTSTTALYGKASTPKGSAGWINETVTPRPKTIYHRSKLEAEKLLENISHLFALPVTVLQMSRCFPEPADVMALYRLTRGIDARDVARAHGCAIAKRLPGFNRFIVSGKTPFKPGLCGRLFTDATGVVREHAPALAEDFSRRGWSLPLKLDRVYDAALAQQVLGWQSEYGYQSVLEMLDNEVAEVLPVQGFG